MITAVPELKDALVLAEAVATLRGCPTEKAARAVAIVYFATLRTHGLISTCSADDIESLVREKPPSHVGEQARINLFLFTDPLNVVHAALSAEEQRALAWIVNTWSTSR